MRSGFACIVVVAALAAPASLGASPGPATGACCLPIGECVIDTAEACGAADGVYQGDDSLCEEARCEPLVGACCVPEGACVAELLPEQCGGEFHLGLYCEEVTCTPVTGACCNESIPDCLESVLELTCELAGGIWQGQDTQCEVSGCPFLGACCFADGSCHLDDQTGCLALGGEYQGGETTCPEGSCEGPANDDCRSATTVGLGQTTFDSLGALTDGPQPCGALGSDVWFRYTATFTGTLEVSTCNLASFDTAIAVYEGCACPVAGPALVCTDDSPGCFQGTSQLQVEVVEGQCYTIQLGGAGGEEGSGLLGLALVIQSCPGAGNCFLAGASPGCNDEGCCTQVCSADPFCCAGEWDSVCVSQAIALCGFDECPGPGSCFQGHGTPGCGDAVCCNTVCLIDAFCCDTQWDGICAEEAAKFCPPPPACPGDSNGDGAVNVQDLVNVIVDWGTNGSGHGGDVNGNAAVDVNDLVMVIVNWGACA